MSTDTGWLPTTLVRNWVGGTTRQPLGSDIVTYYRGLWWATSGDLLPNRLDLGSHYSMAEAAAACEEGSLNRDASVDPPNWEIVRFHREVECQGKRITGTACKAKGWRGWVTTEEGHIDQLETYDGPGEAMLALNPTLDAFLPGAELHRTEGTVTRWRLLPPIDGVTDVHTVPLPGAAPFLYRGENNIPQPDPQLVERVMAAIGRAA